MPKKLSEKEYQLIKQTLIDSGVTTTEHVKEKMKNLLQSAIRLSLISTVITIVISLIFSKYVIFIIMIYCLYMAWVWSSILSSKQYFKRFVEEIVKPK